jgi:hypothetical protein
VITGGDYALYGGDYGDYGDYVITLKDKSCPYFSEEQREQWHKERGLDDPRLKVVEKRRMEEERSVKRYPMVLVPPRPEKVAVDPPPLGEQGMTKEQRYRLRNREKLAAKARERRAKGS